MLSTVAQVLLVWFLVAMVVSLMLGAVIHAGSRPLPSVKKLARPAATSRTGAQTRHNDRLPV